MQVYSKKYVVKDFKEIHDFAYSLQIKTLIEKTPAYEGDSHVSTVHFKLHYRQFSLVTTVHISHFFLL